MTKRTRTKDLGQLIKNSDDPATILGQIYRRFDLPEDPGPRPSKRHSRERRTTAEVQTDDLTVLCEHSLSTWLFGPAPEAREKLGALALSDPLGSEVLEDPRFSKGGLDDGTFPSDPVLMALRRRLRESRDARLS
jgi:hypothetical protein